jgi:murein DD-endopeptidase MepM/ murein hydrolase activator NlpD
LAANYIGKATRVKENVAIRFQPKEANRPDYYDAEGKAVRRAFLRAPFTHGAFRISSRFNPRRFHPILRTYRPHHGTDYAAPYGSRVSSVGKGAVIFAGWKGGYGNCVEVRHNSTYVSRYGHLSRIGVRTGQSIQQGGYVGNVGNTGLSTGPHLHFEMLVNGESRNFLKMDFPAASSVPSANLSDFKRVRDEVMDRFKDKLAQAAPPPTKGTN